MDDCPCCVIFSVLLLHLKVKTFNIIRQIKGQICATLSLSVQTSRYVLISFMVCSSMCICVCACPLLDYEIISMSCISQTCRDADSHRTCMISCTLNFNRPPSPAHHLNITSHRPSNNIPLNSSPPPSSSNIHCFLRHSSQMFKFSSPSISGRPTPPATTATPVGLVTMASTPQSGDSEDRTEREEGRKEAEEGLEMGEQEEQNSVQGIQSRYLRCPSPR